MWTQKLLKEVITINNKPVINSFTPVGIFLILLFGVLVWFGFVVKAHATIQIDYQQQCGSYLYEKSSDYSDSRVNINFESGDEQIDVSGQNGWSVTKVWLDVDNDGHSGYHQYSSGPLNNFNPNPGNDINWAKVEVYKACPTPTATPTPTQTPKQGCEEGYVEVEEECVPVPTPTREPEPTPRPEPGPASAPEQPACKDIRYVPTITGVGRLDSDSIWVTWTKVEDYVNKYLVWYGPSKDLLIWNTFVDGERAEIHHLWPNSHTWVKVAGTHEGCVGNFSAVVDP